MSVLKDAFIEWQEGMDRTIFHDSNLTNKDLIQLEMERLNDCINNQFDEKEHGGEIRNQNEQEVHTTRKGTKC